jgi:hypothetical protein
MLESNVPDTKLPLRNVVNVQTASVCPIKVCINDPVLRFHILTGPSHEPDAKLPFRTVTNLQTLCPVIGKINEGVFAVKVVLLINEVPMVE